MFTIDLLCVFQLHLVDQHYRNEFNPRLGRDYKVVSVSGDSDEKDFFGRVVKDSDLVICTAQILENALINTEEDKHVELTGESFKINNHQTVGFVARRGTLK